MVLPMAYCLDHGPLAVLYQILSCTGSVSFGCYWQLLMGDYSIGLEAPRST